MKAKTFIFGRMKSWALLCAGLLLAAGLIFLCFPHSKKTLKAESILQNGKKMEAQITLQSVWPWLPPERLIDMTVFIDGKKTPVPSSFYSGLGSFDSTKKPLIDEWKGFPELIMFGRRDSSLNEVRWWFLNYSFSALRVEKHNQWEFTYHADAPPSSEVLLPKPTDKTGEVSVLATVVNVKTALPKGKQK